MEKKKKKEDKKDKKDKELFEELNDLIEIDEDSDIPVHLRQVKEKKFKR